MERTCILIKPDGVCKRHVGSVLERFEGAGLRLVALKMVRLSKAEAGRLYHEHRDKPFYEPLLDFMTSAPIVVSVWEGENSVEKARSLIGVTDSRLAQPGTLRKQFGFDNRRNLLHGSDSAQSAQQEIAFFFRAEELFQYAETDWQPAEPVKGT
jgi:nucleoside-diphosphate kinase